MKVMSRRTQIQVKGNRTIFTYAYLFMAAQHALEHAEASEAGRFYDCMSAIMFCAFTLEAYFNHLGKQTFNSWDIIERKLGPKEKLSLLLDILKHKADYSRRPFQTLKDIFRFRDALAHGKTEEVHYEGPQYLSSGERPSSPDLFWESCCTIAYVKRVIEDTELMIEELHNKAGLYAPALGILGEGGYVSECPPEEPEHDSKGVSDK
jgi:hypothetical protein